MPGMWTGKVFVASALQQQTLVDLVSRHRQLSHMIVAGEEAPGESGG
ncbi:hypothetical protein QO004_004875 [Rhizobium mesoamericanum]|nr:hypothetical protein [Rhizobium mesoamericanum]